MNRLRLLALAVFLAVISSCRDEDLNPVPDYETSVHAWGRFNSNSPRNFVFADPSKEITIDFQWNSIDGLNKVTKIEFFYFFDEAYTDAENNQRLARHAGRFLDANGGGKLFKTLQGADIPANRTDISFTVKQDDIYQLFKDATFKYDGVNAVPVFNNPAKPDRSPSSPFVKGDAFEVSWILYTEDGRKFDFWSRSICSEEFTRSSCTVKWGVVCASALAGTFDYVQTEMVGGAGVPMPIPAEITGTVTWTQELDANNNPILGSYKTSDLSFGHFPQVWNDNPANAANGSARVKDACNTLSTSGTDQYGDSYSYSVVGRNGAELSIRWINTYGDGGLVKLTRQDGMNWPPLK
jgi:hypothetical protein